MKTLVTLKEFNKLKVIVDTLIQNQTKIMNQVVDVHKELKQTIELLHATNKNLEIQMSMKRLSDSDLSAA